ncbi:hypothetical protein RclHR1_27880002 [Rhizophagus clarus]|uniref:Uncharacterized protein n=1 Tax=Rhizophagus clarus TaxID=94130 RepID=A0A2Z6R371_9GLOM|nr:hypothetical protein RclHR1_27880002 [Rhizophagus clarus]
MESSNNDSRMITCSSKIDLRSSKNDSRMITDSSKIDLRSSKNDSRMILESSKNDLSRFTSYGQKAIAEAKKNNLLEEFAQNFPSPKERKLYLKQDALSKAKNSDIWAKYVFREAYGINDRTLGDEYKKFLSQVKNVYVTRDNFPVSVSPFDRYRELLNERPLSDKKIIEGIEALLKLFNDGLMKKPILQSSQRPLSGNLLRFTGIWHSLHKAMLSSASLLNCASCCVSLCLLSTNWHVSLCLDLETLITFRFRFLGFDSSLADNFEDIQYLADSCANISFIPKEAVPELKLKADKSIKHSITGASGPSETLGIVKNISIELLPGCIIKEDLVILKGYKHREIGLSRACLKRYNYDLHESKKHITFTYNNKDYFIPIIPDANRT